jgi:transposase-like protein
VKSFLGYFFSCVGGGRLRIKADGEWCYVWAAIDVDTRGLLAIWVSWQRNIMHAEAFLRKALSTCINKPVFPG